MLQEQFDDQIMAIGENLRRLRRDKKWTQGDLAKKCGIKVGQLSKIELNKTDPKLSTIESIIDALECSPNALLSEVGETNLDGRMSMVLERVQALPEEEKEALLKVIDIYCIGGSMQGLMESRKNKAFGFIRMGGKTQEMTD